MKINKWVFLLVNKLKACRVPKKHLCVWLFAFLSLGITLGKFYQANIFWFALTFLLFVVILAFVFLSLEKNRAFDFSILLIVLCLGMLIITPCSNKKFHYSRHREGSFSHKSSELLSGIFRDNFSDDTAGLLDSVILGRRGIDRNTKKVFRDAGTAHLLAISGMHVLIVASVFLLFFSFLRIPFTFRLIVASLLIIAYSLLCFNKPPVLRASIMFFMFSMFSILQRPFLNFHTLALAGIISLLIDPSALFSASFQLSFIAVLFIMVGFRFFWPKHKFSYLQNGILICFVVSFWAIMGTMPLISYYFGKIYLLSWLSGTLTSPLLAFIIYGAFLFLLLQPFAILVSPVATSLEFLIKFFIAVNRAFAEIPFMSIVYRFTFLQVLAYYVLFFIFLYIYKKRMNSLLIKNNVLNLHHKNVMLLATKENK